MKRSLRVIAPARRATHMPTRGRPCARLNCLKSPANRLGFRRVGRPSDLSGWSEAVGLVLAKSACAVSASHSANAVAFMSALFAKKPRARGLCPRPLRKADEKGRGRFGMGRATVGRRSASVMLLPRNHPAKPRAGVAVRPELSKFYCDGLTTSGLRRACRLTGRSWPLICFLSMRARRASVNRTKRNFTARLFVLH